MPMTNLKKPLKGCCAASTIRIARSFTLVQRTNEDLLGRTLFNGFLSLPSLQEPQMQLQEPMLWQSVNDTDDEDDDDDEDDIDALIRDVLASTVAAVIELSLVIFIGKVVFAFCGCYLHSCSRCSSTNRRMKMTYQESMIIVYENTCVKSAVTGDPKYAMHEVWECNSKRTIVCCFHFVVRVSKKPGSEIIDRRSSRNSTKK